jgi:cyclohexadieny/prephenate dehydrogenase
MIYQRVALIGLGLIASSMAHAMRAGGLAGEIVGYAKSPETRAVAKELFCDRVADSAAEAVMGADLVVLAVPIGAMEAIAAEIGPHLKRGATVTDVGSVKQEVIDAGLAPPAGQRAVHPRPPAGRDRTFRPLFRLCHAVPEPLVAADAAAGHRPRRSCRACASFIRALGANVEEMDPAHHDLVLAVDQPHAAPAIAYTMVGVADHMRRVSQSEVIKYSASGFRDFTRIAASDPVMWRDVFLTNKDAVLDILGRFAEELFVLQRAIRMGDGEHLHAYFTRTRAIRRGIIEAGQDTAAPDFGRASPPAQEG